MNIYLAVAKTKKPRVVAVETTYEDCLERANLLARGREFEIVERYLNLDNYGTIMSFMEGCSMEHVEFVINESNAHLPNEFEADKVKLPMKVYLPGEFIEHMSSAKNETKQ